MKTWFKSMLLATSAVMAVVACKSQTFVCCGKTKSKTDCSKSCSTSKKQSNMTTETCPKCGKNSCDTTCSSNINGISENVCTSKTSKQITQEAEAFKKMNAYKRISSVRELETGYEFVYGNADSQLKLELTEFLKLELKCCPTYDYALLVDTKTQTVRYQRFGSAQIKGELKDYLSMVGLLK